MRLFCELGWHKADPIAPWNNGYYFSKCRRCGQDLVRATFGGWVVPKGYRVVWRAAPPEDAAPASLAAEPQPFVPAKVSRGIGEFLPVFSARNLSGHSGPKQQGSTDRREGELPIQEVLRHLESSQPEEMVGNAGTGEKPVAPPPAAPPPGAILIDEDWGFGDEQRPQEPPPIVEPVLIQEIEPAAEAEPSAEAEFVDPEQPRTDEPAVEEPLPPEEQPQADGRPPFEEQPSADEQSSLDEQQPTDAPQPVTIDAEGIQQASPTSSPVSERRLPEPDEDRFPWEDVVEDKAPNRKSGRRRPVVRIAAAVFAIAAVAAAIGMNGGTGGGGTGNPPPAAEKMGTETRPAAAQPEEETGIVTASILNCRSAPSEAAPVVRKMVRGLRVQVLERQPEWTRVAYRGKQCWLAASLLATEVPMQGERL